MVGVIGGRRLLTSFSGRSVACRFHLECVPRGNRFLMYTNNLAQRWHSTDAVSVHVFAETMAIAWTNDWDINSWSHFRDEWDMHEGFVPPENCHNLEHWQSRWWYNCLIILLNRKQSNSIKHNYTIAGVLNRKQGNSMKHTYKIAGVGGSVSEC